MQFHQYLGDVVSLFYKTDKSGGRILNRQELVDGAARQASKDTITVVQSGG